MDIVGFNKTTLTTHIENATQYFQKTTELMSENNAILKEMLEMQRNMYKNAQEQEYQKSDRITYSEQMLKEAGVELMILPPQE